MTFARPAAVATVLTLLLAGCADAAAPTSSSTQPGVSATQLVLPAAIGEPVVMFRGLVNRGQPLGVDLASLDAMPEQTLTVVEPFLQESITFTGVGFADLLSAAGATGQSVTIHALDDYEVTLDASVLLEPGVMLATRADGERLEIAAGGPVRLVFPESSQSGQDSDLWVWSIDQITVE